MTSYFYSIYHTLTQSEELILLLSVIFSLFIGSFLNVVIYRLPLMMRYAWSEECRLYLGLKPHSSEEKINLCLPWSHCTACKKSLAPWHNIPVISYLFLRGKCAYCHTAISIRYPLVEILTCICSVYVIWKFGLSWQSGVGLLFTWICICLTFIDLDHHLLPDQLTLSLLWLGLIASIFSIFIHTSDAILGAVGGYLIFAATQWIFGLATGKIGMGQGDVKFLAALGAILGWKMLPLIILFASLSGVIFSFAYMLIRKHFKSAPLPFGPYLAVAGWVTLLWGQEIMQYYFYR